MIHSRDDFVPTIWKKCGRMLGLGLTQCWGYAVWVVRDDLRAPVAIMSCVQSVKIHIQATASRRPLLPAGALLPPLELVAQALTAKLLECRAPLQPLQEARRDPGPIHPHSFFLFSAKVFCFPRTKFWTLVDQSR